MLSLNIKNVHFFLLSKRLCLIEKKKLQDKVGIYLDRSSNMCLLLQSAAFGRHYCLRHLVDTTWTCGSENTNFERENPKLSTPMGVLVLTWKYNN